MKLLASLVVVTMLWVPAVASADGALTPEQASALLRRLDDQMRTDEDVTSRVLIQETAGGQKVLREANAFERAGDHSMVFLVIGPKTVAGTGYFRVDNNLWFYDPALGKWERRTDRERLSGTNLRASDLSMTPLSAMYDASDDGMERLGDASLRKLVLKAKAGAAVTYPMMKVWIDDTAVERKVEEYSESGKLMRTGYLTKLQKVHSNKHNKDIMLIAEMRLVDEIEKDRQSVLVVKNPVLGSIPDNTFTKGWFEAKSR